LVAQLRCLSVVVSDINKATSTKAKAKDYQFVSRPGQGQVFARARQTTPSVA